MGTWDRTQVWSPRSFFLRKELNNDVSPRDIFYLHQVRNRKRAQLLFVKVQLDGDGSVVEAFQLGEKVHGPWYGP